MSPSSPLPGFQSTPTALILAYKQEQQTDADWIELKTKIPVDNFYIWK